MQLDDYYVASITFSDLFSLGSAIGIVHSVNNNKVLPCNLEMAKRMFTGTLHCGVTLSYI